MISVGELNCYTPDIRLGRIPRVEDILATASNFRFTNDGTEIGSNNVLFIVSFYFYEHFIPCIYL